MNTAEDVAPAGEDAGVLISDCEVAVELERSDEGEGVSAPEILLLTPSDEVLLSTVVDKRSLLGEALLVVTAAGDAAVTEFGVLLDVLDAAVRALLFDMVVVMLVVVVVVVAG